MKMPSEIMNFCQTSWHRPIIPVLGLLMQENTKFRLPLGYVVGPHHKKNNRNFQMLKVRG